MAHIPRAMVVEDDPHMRKIVSKVLTGCGIIVRTAADGLEALNAFRAGRDEPDIICADIRMPNMDGKEFARALRQDGVDVPIVFVSGTIPKAQEGYREKSHVYLVSKPFSPVELGQIVRDMLAKPRPALGPRPAVPPARSLAEAVAPAPKPEAPTPGYSAKDFAVAAKSGVFSVPRAPDRPFAGTGLPGKPPAPAPTSGTATPPGLPPAKKKPHESTVIFMKPTSASAIPPARPGLAAHPSGTMGTLVPLAGPEAAPAPARHFINVERRVREADRPKPGQWIPRLIGWPEANTPEAVSAWAGILAGALTPFCSEGGLGCYALGTMPAGDASGHRWRVRPGVLLDVALLNAVVSRKLRAILLLAPPGLAAESFEPFLRVPHLDRSNVLGLGAALIDMNCALSAPVFEITFSRGETSFLHHLHEECTRKGHAMRRMELRPSPPTDRAPG